MMKLDRRGFGATVLALAGAAGGPAQAATSKMPSVRAIRFDARLDARVAGQVDGHYRPAGTVMPGASSDPLLGPGRPAPYLSVVDSDVDGMGGFVDSATIQFPGGALHTRGIYPSRQTPSGIPGMAHTLMIERVVGGTGAFEDATGHLMLNCTLQSGHIEGIFAGIIFVRG